MEAVKWFVQLVYYYKTDQNVGRPYWKDTKLVGLVVSVVSIAVAKYCGVQIDTELQLKIAAVVIGVSTLFDTKLGVKQLPAEKAADATKAVQEHNLTSLS